MNENNLENKILEKIKHDQLKPKSVWYFLIKDYSLWGLVLISILLASLAIAPIIFIFQNLEIGYVKHISNNIFTFILLVLPYPWIVLCIVTTYFAKKAWEKTKHGYKFNGNYVLVCAFLTSLILGITLNLWNLGKKVDEETSRNGFGYYKSMEQRNDENWFNPENGRIIGVVGTVSATTFIIDNDKNNFIEEVYYDDSVPGAEFIDVDNKLRVIGYKDDTTNFFACAIFPDTFLAPHERLGFREKMKAQIAEKIESNPECKEILNMGRANFAPKMQQK